MFWFIIGLAINIMFTFAVYCRMRDKGYTQAASFMLGLIAILGGVLIFLIVVCMPEVENHEHGYYRSMTHEEWICPKCGKSNIGSFVVCDCGCERPDDSKIVYDQGWTCRVCGAHNSRSSVICDCGAHR